MKTVISGYYGFDNIGDEAVLKCLVEGLKERGITDITVLSNKPDETSKKYNVKAVNRNSFKEIYKALKQSDVLLSGGGSLIQDKTSSKSLWYYLGIMLMGKFLRKKVYVMGQGIGPVDKKFNRWLTARILNKVDGIAVRDELSKEYLKQLNVKKDVVVAADLVLNFSGGNNREIFGKILEKEGIDLNSAEYVLICTREWGNSELSRVELARAADFIAQDYGYKIVFLPFYHEDIEESDRVATYMKMPYEILTGKYEIEEILSIIRSSSLLIGVRLHSLIFAFISLVPFIGISYDPKVEGFLKSVDESSAGDINSFTAEDILKKVSSILQQKEEYINNMSKHLNELKERAKKNFDILFEHNKFEV
ncbi:polysaccharide pyruvyl transferase CsaB [Thermoanaerobacter wiegelii]|uniref:Polysaccharide pyruvyl transferase CsaB n=1 Tax=Thermoanaerobacter wiegelii Rt8.B1 TaxID=697303 RepID=G2MTH4_9THEO|nr:polysaccharide pyruvyl transferase CsaB [Thermoanaerobacter wiegelii]AEM79430.1 polysaccharide pyruvyl transferase CsaB [Thermoanaerobacter wiegelii Rt8.B1]